MLISNVRSAIREPEASISFVPINQNHVLSWLKVRSNEFGSLEYGANVYTFT